MLRVDSDGTAPAVADVRVRSLAVHRRAGTREVRALRGVSFVVPIGQVLAIAGPVGAGKSTLLAVLAGKLAPTAGEACVLGLDPRALAVAEGPVSTALVGPRADSSIARRLGWRSVGAGRSDGERRLARIRAVGAEHHALLLADDPTRGLDPAHAQRAFDALRGRPGRARTVIVASADPAAAAHADRALVLRAGRIVADLAAPTAAAVAAAYTA